MLFSKSALRKVLGLVAECWPSLRSHSAAALPPCQQHRLFPPAAGWRQIRLLGFRCLTESHLGYEFEITLESEPSQFEQASMLQLQPQNSYSKIALWLTSQQLTGCQTVSFQRQQVPLCQALACVELANRSKIAAANLSEWLAQQGLMPEGHFTILQSWQHGHGVTLRCRTTDCLSRACYHWLQQQAIRFQLIYTNPRRYPALTSRQSPASDR